MVPIPDSSVTMHAAQGSQDSTAPGTYINPRLGNKATIHRLGIAELVMGGLLILLTNISQPIVHRELRAYWPHYRQAPFHFYDYATLGETVGTLGGICAFIAGILGVWIKHNPTRCMYVTNMVWAIVAAWFIFWSAVISSLVALYYVYSSALITIYSTVALLNALSMIATICHAALCCMPVWC